MLLVIFASILIVSGENTSFLQKFKVQEETKTRWFQERRIIQDHTSTFEVVTLNTCKVKDREHGLSTANQLNFLGCNVTLDFIDHLNETLTSPIKRLQFFSSRLDGNFESMKYFKDLRYLNMVNSTLAENFTWTGIKRLQKLEFIKLESSNLGRFLEDSCSLCLPTSLRTVIFKNSFTNVTSSDFAGLAYLKFLDMSYNKIDVIHDHWRRPDGLFDDLVTLEVLDMSYNKFSQLNSTFFKGLSSLKELCLAGNDIVRLPNDTFKNLWRLAVLDLSFNKMTEFHNELLVTTRNLRELNLIGNPLPGLMKHDFRYFRKLNVLFNWKERSMWYRVSDVFFDFYENEIRDM